MPAPLVCSTALMQCSFGSTPASLIVLPDAQVLVEGNPAASVQDSIALTNVPVFGTCSSLSNPTVASATAAANGVLTPQACTPQPVAWTPGVPLVVVGGMPAVNGTCTTTCALGGAITITNPGSRQTMG